MTLCDCGKPTSHKGMCTARWAKRKANNGPAGIKAKPATDNPPDVAAPMSEEAIARRLFGELADDILLLRKRGYDVARFKGDFRVDREVLSAEQLSAKAKALRSTQERAKTEEIHRGAKQPKGCAKVMRADPSMSGSVVASGDAVRDASAMPLDVVAALHSEGREHAGSAATAPPACPQDTDLRARIAQLEQRVEFLLAVVADAISGRRVTLLVQAEGLTKLETQLRTAA
jgi:hypothetical protein